ncbi:hypothetical protein FHI69_02945 [Janthinobacterium lividum]|uniref:Uncharacterized protein n=1 Tax=Janthinobacterium lividum TaxID=29581 RepID=A0A5C4P112_9BURK|nr:hypothetical protein [Janthinobacterium lividum]TNC78269.1 hypothetical protein FHI69_02945 [Janthinobacterium lividum]
MTIKIVSTDPASQGPFVVINKSDFNPDVHELYGDDNDLDAAAERVPTMAELLAARDQLLDRERELAKHQERIAEQARENEAAADRVAEQAQANEVEAQRLRVEAASLQDAKDAAAAAAQPQAAPATATATAEKPAKAAKA